MTRLLLVLALFLATLAQAQHPLLRATVNRVVSEWEGDTPSIAGELTLAEGTCMGQWYLEDFLLITLDSTYFEGNPNLFIRFRAENQYLREERISPTIGKTLAVSLNDLNDFPSEKQFSVIIKNWRKEEIKGFHYAIQQQGALTTWRFVTYAIILLSIIGALALLANRGIFAKASHYRSKRGWTTVISLVANFLVAVLLVDEIGLALVELNVRGTVFEALRGALQFEVIPYAIYIAGVCLVVPSVYVTSQETLRQLFDRHVPNERPNLEPFISQWSFYLSVLCVLLTLVIFFLQCAITNEFEFPESTSRSLLDELQLVVFIILILWVTIRLTNLRPSIIKNQNPYWQAGWFKNGTQLQFLYILFISFTQTMITKVIMLLNVINWSKKYVRRFSRGVVPASTPLSFDQSINASGAIEKFSFMVLTTTLMPLLVLFQVFSSPYPPTDSIYPKSTLISLAYMSFMILFVIVQRFAKEVNAAWVAWIVLTVFLVVGLPFAVPTWFLPAPTRTVSLAEICQLLYFSDRSIQLALSLMLLAMWLSGFQTTALEYWSNQRKEFLIQQGEVAEAYGNYIVKGLLLGLITLLPICLVISMALGSQTMRLIELASYFTGDFMMSNIAAIVLGILAAASMYPIVSATQAKLTKHFLEEWRTTAGDETVKSVCSKNPFLRMFTDPAYRMRKALVLLLIVVSFYLLYYSVYRISTAVTGTNTELAWTYRIEKASQSGVTQLLEINHHLVCASKNQLHLFTPDGEPLWNVTSDGIASLNPVGDSALVVSSEREISLMRVPAGDTLWRVAADGYGYTRISGGLLSVEGKRPKKVIDVRTGAELAVLSPDVMERLTLDGEGAIYWVVGKDSAAKFDDRSRTLTHFGTFPDLLEIRALANFVFALSDDSVLALSSAGTRLWKVPTKIQPQNLQGISQLNDLLIFNYLDRIVAIDNKSGAVRWMKSMHRFDRIHGNWILARKSSDMIVLDSLGNPINTIIGFYEMEFVLEEENRLVAADGFSMRVYDWSGGRISESFFGTTMYELHGDLYLEDIERLRIGAKLFTKEKAIILNGYGLYAFNIME